MQIITNRYRKETGLSAYKHNWLGKRIHNQAYIDWLEKQCTIPRVSKRLWYFDCWDKNGKTTSRQIEALNAENAEIILKHRHPGLNYDPPY